MHRRKLIAENPFDDVRAAATGIKDRLRFISREEIDRVLDACPSIDWRVIVSLARYGGLRTPSETLSLRWQDIDWAAGRIVVQSPKTSHHPGKGTRTIPLFAELRPILTEAFELAPEGAEYVVDPRFRKAAMGPGGWLNTNLRTTFIKIICRAGLPVWPRVFHNLRASFETELVESYPVQTVTSWLGNSPSVALRHYLMTTKEHFDAAVKGNDSAAKIDPNKAAQKAAQQVRETSSNKQQAFTTNIENPLVFPHNTSICDTLLTGEVAATGFEPVTHGL
ncbi:MAG: tyrosine-type recombinase/integrase [Pirellulales bacterium]|nr:tyrosine-type recombinase/integrase [Pirellulales bacterium]